MATIRPLLALGFAVLALAGCGGDDEKPAVPAAPASQKTGPYAGDPVERAGLRLPARVRGRHVALARKGGFAPRFWAGANLGATIPGHHPGELAPSRADYDRWLGQMHELGVRVVRVYTILRPQFYDALAAHNARHPGEPLRFIQGVWIPEEALAAAQDLYAPAVTDGFDAELADAVAVVHGDATLPERPGHASGTYATDVSRWLLAWSPGVEWDPFAVRSTDRAHARQAPLPGRYVQASEDATPTEQWLAARLDHLATLEVERGWSRPLTFTNWVTTDPLEHPAEPLAEEDLVSVDATHLRATRAWPGGLFASYHVYPYYPDFLRLEPRYAGAEDPYAAYLRDLRAHHGDQAVMVTEFGVPTGLGAAHRGPLGRDQGSHAEREAAAIDADLLGAIRREGYAGGLLFEWTDEWFKRTWNTMALAQPEERRVLWHNVLTNESQFGVIATEPGRRPLVALDGDAREWERGRVVVREPGTEVRAAHDAAHLYLLVRRADAREPLRLGLDTRPGGTAGLPGAPGVAPEADVALTLGPGRRATLRQARAMDPLPALYDVEPGRGPWVRPRMLLSRPQAVPGTGEKRPAEVLDLGRLRWGDAEGDGRVLAAGTPERVELRIPWMLLGFADPSSRSVYEVAADGTVATRQVDGIGITAGGPAARYGWRTWTAVQWHERRKAGWPVLARAFARTTR